MLEYLWSYGAMVIDVTGHLNRTQWLLCFAAAFVIGILLMKSGSRYT